MEREYIFRPELLRMMLSEERQKFISALGSGASWRELRRIRKTIAELNELLDSTERRQSDFGPRSDQGNPRG
jgi:hypothetical protein